MSLSMSSFGFQAFDWKIEQGQIMLNKHANDQKAQAYWTFITDLLPDRLLDKYVAKFTLWSDGPEEDLAGFAPLNEFNTEWHLDVDTVDFDIKNQNEMARLDAIYTLIHEYGHLLTLNPEQIQITNDEYQDDDRGYLTNEGYAETGSYLGEFVKAFWNDHLLLEWDDIDPIKSEKRRSKKIEQFYYQHQEYFLSGYSAESPEEDIAESWTFFVLCDRPTIDEYGLEKIKFFYQFPELIEARSYIRKNIEFIPKDFLSYFKENFEDY